MESILKCDICGQSGWQDQSNLLVKCVSCGLVRAKMNPSADELSNLYQRDYFFGGEYADYLNDQVALELNFSARLKKLAKYLNADTFLIEIGCSYGFFLNLAKAKVGRSIGVDVTREGIEYAVKNFGLDARCDDFLNYHGEQSDIICMWDVIEHLSNPDKYIEKISASLKSGGHLALTTGDFGSLVARLRGDKWRMVHPPTHLFYFDKASMSKLLNKHGLEIVDFSHQTVYRNVDSVLRQLIVLRPGGLIGSILKALHAICEKTGLGKLNFGLNLFDIMEVVAVKR